MHSNTQNNNGGGRGVQSRSSGTHSGQGTTVGPNVKGIINVPVGYAVTNGLDPCYSLRIDDSLKHVPCKFFRQGNCTAGDSCVFSHQSATAELCKYYLKGNCKFGNKCALEHGNNGGGGGTNGTQSRFRRRTGGHANGSGSAHSGAKFAASNAPSTASVSNLRRGLGQASSLGASHAVGDTLVDPAITAGIAVGRVSAHHAATLTSHTMPIQSGSHFSVGLPNSDAANAPTIGIPGAYIGGGDMRFARRFGVDTPPVGQLQMYESVSALPGSADTDSGLATITPIGVPFRRSARSMAAVDNVTGESNSRSTSLSDCQLAHFISGSATETGVSQALGPVDSPFSDHSLGTVGLPVSQALPRAASYAVSPFGGRRSVLLSLSYDSRSSDSSLLSSKFTRRISRRSASTTGSDALFGLHSELVRDTRSTLGRDGEKLYGGSEVDDGDASISALELDIDDFQPDFFPSSLDELLTPSELEKRRRRESSKSHDLFRPSTFSPGAHELLGDKQSEKATPPHPRVPLRATALDRIAPSTRGIPMSMPNFSSLGDYDRFDPFLSPGPIVGSIESVGTPTMSPGTWMTHDTALNGSLNGAAPLSGTAAASTLFDALNGPFASRNNNESQFTLALDDEGPFRMDDLADPLSSHVGVAYLKSDSVLARAAPNMQPIDASDARFDGSRLENASAPSGSGAQYWR